MSVKSMLSSAERSMSGKKRTQLAVEAIKHSQPIPNADQDSSLDLHWVYNRIIGPA